MKNLKAVLKYNWLFVCLFVFIVFYIIISTKIIRYKSIYSLGDSKVSGTITEINVNGNKLSLEIKGKEKIIAFYYLKTEAEKLIILDKIHIGDKINANGSFKEPNNNTIPNNFNYKKYLYNKKIYYTFDISNFEVSKNNNAFYHIKDFLVKRCYKLKNSEYYLLFILGNKTLLDSEIYQAFQTNGVSHLLAISGMHISIIIAILNMFLKKLNEYKKTIIISIILLFFAILTSFSASVLRAVLFFILNKINTLFNLRLKSLHILFITAFLILLFNPFMLYDLGFIYSFVVCAGIIYYSEKLKDNYFKSILKISFISFLFSLPITALLNYEINILGIFVNLIFVPLVTFIIFPLSLISFVLPLLSPIFSLSLIIMNFLNLFFANFSLIINIPKMSIILLVLYYVILIISKNNYKLLSILVLIILTSKILPRLDSNYYVYYLDVGQGDSAVLISPFKSEVIMIDTGGKIFYNTEKWRKSSKKYNLSDNTIKFLKSLGITKLDYLILSHGDEDHAGEALNILKQLNVKNIVLNNGDLNTLEKKISDKGNITNKYKLKNFKIKDLNQYDYNNENENSIINYISFLKYNLLFMGDATIKQEKEIINKYNFLKIDILKLGHHGSKTSSCKEFIDFVNPKYSIISVGKNNRYGHPNSEVLGTLGKNSKIYRTDLDGSIIFKIKKDKMDIGTCPP